MGNTPEKLAWSSRTTAFGRRFHGSEGVSTTLDLVGLVSGAADRFDQGTHGIGAMVTYGEEEDRLSYRSVHAVLACTTQRQRIEEPWMAPAWKGLMLITSGVPCQFTATIVCSMDHAGLLSSIRSTSTRAVTCSQRQSLLVGDGLARWVRSDLARCIGSPIIRRYRCE